MPSERIAAQQISPSERIAYAAAIRRRWTAEPTLTVADMLSLSKAPKPIVLAVRRKLVVAGVVKAHDHARRATVIDEKQHDAARAVDPQSEAGHA